MLEATLLPVVLRDLPPVALTTVFMPGSPVPEVLGVMWVGVVFYVVGFVLLSVTALRSGALPRGAAVMVLVGVVSQFLPLPGIGHGLTIVLHNAGLLWLAIAVLRGSAESAPLGAPAGALR